MLVLKRENLSCALVILTSVKYGVVHCGIVRQLCVGFSITLTKISA